jgi:restriction system protein
MGVPGFQNITLPLLRLAADGQRHRLTNAIAELATEFGLNDEERDELLPSGKQSRFANRVGWARTYLGKAGLLASPAHGIFEITERGQAFVATASEPITILVLDQFAEFREFRAARHGSEDPSTSGITADPDRTPDEMIEASINALNERLRDDLLAEVKRRSPLFFENLVIDLLVRMGYGGSHAEAAERLGRSGDGGIDGIIKEDKLGLDVIYIQAKRWEGTVGRPVVQAFAGSLMGNHAQKGVLITTSGFSGDALHYVDGIGMKVVLIDGQQLAGYMIQYGVGVAEVASYSVKRVALDELEYFESD